MGDVEPLDAVKGVLERLQTWDMLHLTPEGRGASTLDAPWARAEIRDALEAVERLRVLVAERDAENTRLRNENEAWIDWSNHLAEQMPEHYDGDEAQEEIIDRWIGDLRAENTKLRTALDERDIIIHRLVIHHDWRCPSRLLCDERDATGVPAAKELLAKTGKFPLDRPDVT